VGASRWALRVTELSPYDETAVRRLIELLDRSGDRAGRSEHTKSLSGDFSATLRSNRLRVLAGSSTESVPIARSKALRHH